MREYMVRMLIRTNDTEPGDARHGEPPYHSDQEMPLRIREWFDAILEDRDDGPEIVWSEFRMRETALPGTAERACDDCGHPRHPAGPCGRVTDGYGTRCPCGTRVER